MQPTFTIRDIPIYGDLILAPMAGFSDKPYRLICREYGSAMSYTEFAFANSILHDNEPTRRLLDFDPSERPVAIQIFGSDEASLEEAARKVEQLGPDVIDLNLGCSAPKVLKRGGGAGLLPDPVKIGRIAARLSRALAAPLTAKIRLGWDEDSLNYIEVARALEDNGAALVAVHGRTQAQNYDARANWDAIAQIKQALRIPVIGNGDVDCAQDIERIKRHTGCDAVMIGRAAAGNPWIFQRRELGQVTLAERIALMRRHLNSMVVFYGPERGPVNFRKHAIRYLRGLPHIAELKARLLACASREEFVAALSAYA